MSAQRSEAAYRLRASEVRLRLLIVAARHQRRDEMRAMRRSMADASFLGLYVPPHRHINRRKWWWQV